MPKKPVSTILEAFQTEEEDIKELIEIATPTAEEEIPLEEIQKRKKILFLVCPFCGMHRVIEKKGTGFIKQAKKENIDVFEEKLKTGEYIKSERSKFYNPNKEVRFDLYNFKEEPFISIRVSIGGKGQGGIYEIGSLTIEEVLKLPENIRSRFIKYLQQLKDQAEKFLKYLEEINFKNYL